MQAFPRAWDDGFFTIAAQGGLMPTVPRAEGFRLYFFSSDRREPPHVHVDRGGSSAKIWLERGQLARNLGFAPHELGDTIRLVRRHQHNLLEAWHVQFGTDPGR